VVLACIPLRLFNAVARVECGGHVRRFVDGGELLSVAPWFKQVTR
jgi:hypothetical protein